MGKYGYSVFVGNIGRRVRSDDIRDPFKKFGRILDVDLKNGFGFVEFEDQRDAADAVKELNGIRIQGDRIKVELSKVKRLFNFTWIITHINDNLNSII